jgi:hypothetical protein
MKIKRITLTDDIARLQPMCAWNYCKESPHGDLTGWLQVFAYEAPQPIPNIMHPEHWHRHKHDVVLCPKHARLFSEMLKPAVPADRDEIEIADTPH